MQRIDWLSRCLVWVGYRSVVKFRKGECQWLNKINSRTEILWSILLIVIAYHKANSIIAHDTVSP